MSIYLPVANASLEQLEKWWHGGLPKWAESRESLLEEVGYALSQAGDEGVAFLKLAAHDANVKKRWAAVYFLAAPHLVDAEVMGYLQDAFAADNLKLKTAALWGYIHINQFPLPRAHVEALLHQSNERMAALAMVYLSYAYPEETTDILGQALFSTNPRQRESACDEIGDRNIVELEVALGSLIEDEHDDVREAARCNLEMLHSYRPDV